MLHTSPKVISLLILEEKIFKGFYQIWVCQPSWPCDHNNLYTFWQTYGKESSYEIFEFNMVYEKTMFKYIDGTPIRVTLAERSKVNLNIWNLFIVIV